MAQRQPGRDAVPFATSRRNVALTEPHDSAQDALPFAAPCRKLQTFAAFGWLARGATDLRRAPLQSLVYGISVAALTAAVFLLAWQRGGQWFLFAMLGGVVFLAPLTCIGLYAISAQLERGQPPSLRRSLRAAFRRYFANEMIFAVVLLVIFLVWARAAVLITVFFPSDGEVELADLAPYLLVGSAVGAIFAAVTFAASAFSLPMIMHRNVDVVTAIVTSVNAVLRNKRAMLVWMALVLLLFVAGVLTAFLGLVVAIPLIGYAAWHAYQETIDASEFPRHGAGITATPRAAQANIDAAQ